MLLLWWTTPLIKNAKLAVPSDSNHIINKLGTFNYSFVNLLGPVSLFFFLFIDPSRLFIIMQLSFPFLFSLIYFHQSFIPQHFCLLPIWTPLFCSLSHSPFTNVTLHYSVVSSLLPLFPPWLPHPLLPVSFYPSFPHSSLVCIPSLIHYTLSLSPSPRLLWYVSHISHFSNPFPTSSSPSSRSSILSLHSHHTLSPSFTLVLSPPLLLPPTSSATQLIKTSWETRGKGGGREVEGRGGDVLKGKCEEE